MGLEDLTGNDPSDNSNPNLGASWMRTIIQKVKESFSKEHALSGIHAILKGTTTQRPSAGNKGRLFIIETPGKKDELQQDTGAAWQNITVNQDFEDNKNNLSDHKAATSLDHPSASVKESHLVDEGVTGRKIKAGSLMKKHFISGSSDETPVNKLVDGSEIDSTFHTHTAVAVPPTFLSTHIMVDSDSEGKSTQVLYGDSGWKTKDVTDSFPNASALIMQAKGNAAFSKITAKDKKYIIPVISIRKDSDSNAMPLIGGRISESSYANIELGWKGQGIFPLNTNNNKKKFQYKVEDFNISWEIEIVGYF